tara:strand:- start:401 stop:964 length:564 start_codon:yes stop_codon:yes gene_type:complete
MAYFSQKELHKFGFKKLGKNVLLSTKASIYNYELIEINDNSRIDDFCSVSGNVSIGKYVHLAPYTLIAGGEPGVFIENHVTCAYGVKVFSQSDDYSGESLTNSLLPKKYKNELKKKIILKKHTIIGAGAIIMPGATLEEGTAIGASSLVLRSTKPWSINYGIPSKHISSRSREMTKLWAEFEKEHER